MSPVTEGFDIATSASFASKTNSERPHSAKGKALLAAFALFSDEEQLDALRSVNVPWDAEVRAARPSSMEEWYGGHNPYISQKDYENEVKYLEEEVGDTFNRCTPRRA
jgi:hypothetical protein